MKRINESKPTAFVLGMSITGLTVTRSLGRKGIAVITIDKEAARPGFVSKYCKKVFLTDRADIEDQLISYLITEGKKLDSKGVLLVCADEYILLISRNRERLEPYFILSLPSKDLTEKLINKEATYELARKYSIPIPNTYYAKNLEDIEIIKDKIRYPCALKPKYSHIWRKSHQEKKLIPVESADQLIKTYSAIAAEDLEVIITEIIPGKDDQLYALYTYFDKNSNPIITFTKKKIRQLPIDFGVGTVQMSIWEPTVAELGIRFLKDIGYAGMAMVEFKKDPNDHLFKLIEVNVRCGLSIGLTIKSGIDFPYIVYQDLIGNKVAPISHFQEGVKWLWFTGDFQSFLQYRARGELTFLKWLATLKGKKAYAFFAWDDLKPFIVYFISFALYLLRAVTSKIINYLKFT